MRKLLFVAALASCHHAKPAEVVATPKAGVSIAMYGKNGGGAYGVVDDRRLIDVQGTAIQLTDVDPGAALPSLVIETLDGAPLKLGACERARAEAEAKQQPAVVKPVGVGNHRRRPVRVVQPEAVATETPELYAPVVTCAVTGAPGKRLVRLLYVSNTLSYQAEHDVEMTQPGKAMVTTRFSIETPEWQPRDGKVVNATVVLYDGVPGGDRTPVEVGRGAVDLDGSAAVISPPAREVPVTLRRIYNGASEGSDETVGIQANDPSWNMMSQEVVWVWMELANVRLPPGPLHVHVETTEESPHDVIVPAENRKEEKTGSVLRLPLWTDDQLRGARQRMVVMNTGTKMREHLIASVSNTGDTPREVWIEERLRPAQKRTVSQGFPAKPAQHGEYLRSKVVVKPTGIERIGYSIDYVF